jgi:hypothetical protein
MPKTVPIKLLPYNALSMLRKSFCIACLIVMTAARSLAANGDSAQSWAFVPPKDYFFYNAMLDLRDLNETAAGQSGFVRISREGDFVRGDGTPIRFWACGTDEFTADPLDLSRHARFLAKLGVNMIRLHAQIGSDADAPELKEVNQKEIDGIRRAVAAFKRVGIYVTISPYWANDRPARRWGIKGYEREADLYGLLFFNSILQEGYKAWVRKLYDEVNPYTGIPLARDPAVAIIQIQNEDGMFFWTMDAIKPPQKILLGEKFAAWLMKKYGSLDHASDAWDDVKEPGDQFQTGDVAILSIWELTQPQHGGKARRVADQVQFFADTQRNFYADMVRFYRDELGCRQLINCSNWITADPVRLNDVERYTNTVADVLAVNKYFTGTHVGANVGWQIDSGDCFTNHPGVLNPWDLPTNLKQVVGHPMIVTETSWVSPMDYQNEGPFLVAAYQSLTGVAGCYWFTATAERYEDDLRFGFPDANGQYPLHKWTCSTPALMGNFPAAALMYRRGYLKRGEPVIIENRPLADLWKRRTPLISEGLTFDPNRMSGQPGRQTDSPQDANPLAFLVGPVRVNYGGDPAKNKIADLSHNIDIQKKIITSNTGQIRLDYNIGLCTIDAPAAQGATGFLKNAGPIHLGTIDIASTNEQASVLVVSMDGKALNESRSILVQVGTPSRLTHWVQEPTDFTDSDQNKYHGFKIVKLGRPPWLIQDADVTLSIRNRNLTKMTALDMAGYASRELPLRQSSEGVELQFPSHAMYAVLQ